MRQGWRLRRIMWGKKNFFIAFILYISFIPGLGQMAFNVPAVTDVFLRLIRKNAKHFYGRKKMWRSKIPQRGEAPTGILRSLAAVRRRTVTDLLGDVCASS